MKEKIEASVLLHDTPGVIIGDCGHLVDLRSYFVRLHLCENGIRYRYDVCSIACLRRVCERKNIDDVSLNGSGWVPVKPHGRKRERIEG